MIAVSDSGRLFRDLCLVYDWTPANSTAETGPGVVAQSTPASWVCPDLSSSMILARSDRVSNLLFFQNAQARSKTTPKASTLQTISGIIMMRPWMMYSSIVWFSRKDRSRDSPFDNRSSSRARRLNRTDKSVPEVDNLRPGSFSGREFPYRCSVLAPDNP